jgi:hypothetical protein
MKWLKRITDYYKDTMLAEKCGLSFDDICVHESDSQVYKENNDWTIVDAKTNKFKCLKCGTFYKRL